MSGDDPRLASTGAALWAIRNRAGLTQQQLAQKAGISLSMLFQLEQGMWKDMKLSRILRLADALDMTPGKLVDELTDAAAGQAALARKAEHERSKSKSRKQRRPSGRKAK